MTPLESAGSAALLSIFLLDKSTAFEGKVAHYVTALYDRSDPSHPFVPLELSHNIHSVRNSLINEIKNYQDDLCLGTKKSKCFKLEENHIDGFKKHIGHAIMTNLNMLAHFEVLWKRKKDKKLDEICIVTNDAQIPWEWAYNKATGEFFCETFSYGKLFFEYIEDYYKFLLNPSSGKKACRDENEFKQELQQSHAVLLYDDWEHEKSQCLTNVKKEIESLNKILMQSGFIEKHIHSIDGKDSDAESIFLHHLSLKADSIKIIHFSGHIDKEGMKLRDGAVEPEELASILPPEKGILFSNRPIVFLNGCYSGNITDAWEHEKNLSTVFTKLGAVGTICSHFPIADDVSWKLPQIFYDCLIKFDQRVGLALREARRKFRETVCGDSDLTWLFYTLYGDPSVRLFPKSTQEDIQQEMLARVAQVDIKSLSERM